MNSFKVGPLRLHHLNSNKTLREKVHGNYTRILYDYCPRFGWIRTGKKAEESKMRFKKRMNGIDMICYIKSKKSIWKETFLRTMLTLTDSKKKLKIRKRKKKTDVKKGHSYYFLFIWEFFHTRKKIISVRKQF